MWKMVVESIEMLKIQIHGVIVSRNVMENENIKRMHTS